MQKKLLREVVILSVIFVVMALLLHSDLVSDPFSRFAHMQQRGNYLHPLFYTFIFYMIFSILRFLVHLIKRLFFLKIS